MDSESSSTILYSPSINSLFFELALELSLYVEDIFLYILLFNHHMRIPIREIITNIMLTMIRKAKKPSTSDANDTIMPDIMMNKLTIGFLEKTPRLDKKNFNLFSFQKAEQIINDNLFIIVFNILIA